MEISIKWNICRVCLHEERADSPTMKSIFAESRLAKQIVECAGIELRSNDGLPEKICRKCLLTLKYAVSFRTTCRKSDEHLRSVIKKAKQAANLDAVENTLAVEEIEDMIEELEDGTDEYVYIIDVEDGKGNRTTAEDEADNKSAEMIKSRKEGQVIKREKYNLIDLTSGDDAAAARQDNSYSVEIMPADPLTAMAVEEEDEEEMTFSEIISRKIKHSPSKNYESEINSKALEGFFSENEIYTVHETQEQEEPEEEEVEEEEEAEQDQEAEVDEIKVEDSDLSYIKVRISNGSDEEYVLGDDDFEEEEEEFYEDIQTSDEGGKLRRIKSSTDKSILVKRPKYNRNANSKEASGVCKKLKF